MEDVVMVVKHDIGAIRLQRLRQLSDKHGGPTALGKLLGYSGSSYVSQMILGERPITEKTARKIEEKLGLEQWFMDKPEDEPLPFAGTDRALIAAVVRAVGEELERKKLRPQPAKFAELVAMTYEKSAVLGHIDLAYLRSLVTLLS